MQTKRYIKQHGKMWKVSLKKGKKEFKQCVGKLEKVWKALKSLGLTNKSGVCIISALEENQIVKHCSKSILKTF